MRDTIDGFLRFQHDACPARSRLFRSLVTRQAPKALFTVCSDNRVVPELLTQREPGGLFVIRNADDIVPGYGPQPGGVSASVEYAVAMLGVGGIMVCGHSDCGAMGTIASRVCLDQLPAVADWLHNVGAAQAMNNAHEHASGAVRLDALVRHNVIAQLANLRIHPCVARVLKQGRLNLHGWVCDIKSGRIDAPDGASRRFVSLAEHPKMHAVGGTPGQTVA